MEKYSFFVETSHKNVNYPEATLNYCRFPLYPLTFSLLYDIIHSVYALGHNFMEDIMDDGDGETCHCMKIIRFSQA